MNETRNSKQYDLEDRTFEFAKNTALYVKQLPKNISNLEYGKQVVGASGSVGANYIEANEALSKKDFIMRVNPVRNSSGALAAQALAQRVKLRRNYSKI